MISQWLDLVLIRQFLEICVIKLLSPKTLILSCVPNYDNEIMKNQSSCFHFLIAYLWQTSSYYSFLANQLFIDKLSAFPLSKSVWRIQAVTFTLSHLIYTNYEWIVWDDITNWSSCHHSRDMGNAHVHRLIGPSVWYIF